MIYAEPITLSLSIRTDPNAVAPSGISGKVCLEGLLTDGAELSGAELVRLLDSVATRNPHLHSTFLILPDLKCRYHGGIRCCVPTVSDVRCYG
jgi:hypothetical protein